ncbi:MAG TPA: NAD(P)H-binding protein [Parvibaculum sp.]
MTGRTALVAGATGLVGGHLVARLLASPLYEHVLVVTRRKSGLAHPKLREIVADFDKLEGAIAATGEKIDDAFCALGTTIKRAGSQDAFRRVDYDYVVAFAKAAKAAGARQFLLVTAIGSSAKSGIFYSRVKGEAEDAVAALGFATTHIFRPSMLLGRRGEARPAEAVAQALTPFINPLLLGPAAAYRGIAAETVAASMAGAALKVAAGLHFHTYRSMTALARR